MNIYEELWNHCVIAYNEPKSISGFKLPQDNIFFSHQNKKDFFYLVECRDKIILTFRGTDKNIRAWVSNLKFITKNPTYGIHGGWYSDWIKLKDIIGFSLLSYLHKSKLPVYITGYSRGAIFAQLTCRMLMRRGINNKCIVFGSPRVGGIKFLIDMESEDCNVARIVNGWDIADIYPFDRYGYMHYGIRKWYKKSQIRRFFIGRRISDHINYDRIVNKL